MFLRFESTTGQRRGVEDRGEISHFLIPVKFRNGVSETFA